MLVRHSLYYFVLLLSAYKSSFCMQDFSIYSYLTYLPTELIQNIARKLDGKSMAHFASSCGMINKKLNTFTRWMTRWHECGARPPFKVLKDYVNHNETIIYGFTTQHKTELQKSFSEFNLTHEYTDLKYNRIGKHYERGVLFNVHSPLNEPIETVIGPRRTYFNKKYGEKSFFIAPLLTIIISQAHHAKSIHFFLKQSENLIPSSKQKFEKIVSKSIASAICAFNDKGLFCGDATRCIDIIKLLITYKADVHYTDPIHKLTILHRAAFCSHGHLILPYLFTFGIDINAQDIDGNTPLTLATMSFYFFKKDENVPEEKSLILKRISLLIDGGANHAILNKNNESFLSFLPSTIDEDVENIINKRRVSQ